MILSILLLAFQDVQEGEPAPERGWHELSVKADVWFASLEGSGRLNKWFGKKRDGEENSPRMSFDREGRLREAEPFTGLELRAIRGTPNQQYQGLLIQLRYASWSQSGTIDDPFTIDGTTVPSGSPYRSRLEMWMFHLDWIAGIRFEKIPLDLSGFLGLHFHREDFKMVTSVGNLEDAAGGLSPGIGIRLEYRPLAFFFTSGELSTSGGLGVPESQAVISAGLTWGAFRLEGGYRHLWAAWDADPDIRLTIGGPFIGLTARF